jgi:hypothetical protein
VKIDPVGTTTGAITIKGWAVEADASLGTISRNGTPITVTTTGGQNATMTFSGTVGDRVMIQTSGSSYTRTPEITFSRPKGTVAHWYGNLLTAVHTLPATGTYTIKVDPRLRDAGSITVRAFNVPDDANAGTLHVNGATETVTTTAGGQNAFIKFSGDAGDKIKITTSNSSYEKGVRMQLRRANGKVVYARTGVFTSKVIKLPVSGTYTLFFNPVARDTGSIKVKVFTP